MTVRVAAMAAVLLTALLLDSVVLPAVAIAGWRPNLVILSVVAFALADGAETGARYGFVAGVTSDLLADGTSLVGLGALVLLLVGYAVGVLRPYLSGTAVFGEIALAGLATVCAVAGYGLLALLLEVDPFRPGNVVHGALVTGGYNALLAPLVTRSVGALSKRFGATLTGV